MFGSKFAFCLLTSTMLSMPVLAADVTLYNADTIEFKTENGIDIAYTADGKTLSGALILPDDEGRQITYFYRNGEAVSSEIIEYEGIHSYGEYTIGDMNQIVSSGLTGWGWGIRNEGKCEYVLININ